jgi:ribonuclease P protein component
MRRSPDFRETVRRGRRAGSRHLVVHLVGPSAPDGPTGAGPTGPEGAGPEGAGPEGAGPEGAGPEGAGPEGAGAADAPVTAGFVVSRAVGGSVVRHRVQRRLRHLVAARLGDLPAGTRLVVRANPGAASATSLELAADLDRGLRTAQRPPRSGPR